MPKPIKTAVSECPKCHAPIGDDHPYGWCAECGEPLTKDVLARLPTQKHLSDVVPPLPGEPVQSGALWYYSRDGKRYGPANHETLRKLVADRTLRRDSPVWRTGMSDWTPAVETELSTLFSTAGEPPPLPGKAIDNSIVWILAFVPIAAAIAQHFLVAVTESPQSSFWWIAIPMNIALCLIDSHRLKNAGHDTDGMVVWALLIVPVYLFVRASRLKQSKTYAFVWLVTFVISLYI